MADDLQLSEQDIKDLQEISSKLPAGDARQKKISVLLNSSPTKFESDRPGTGANLQGSGAAAWNTLKNQFSITPESLAERAIDPVGLYSGLKSAYNAGNEAKAGYQRGGLGQAALSGAGSLVGVSAKSAAEHADRGEGGAIVGEAAVPALETAAAYGAARGLPAARRAISENIYSPQGTLKPGYRTASQLGGAVAGGAHGAVSGHPYEAIVGAGAGYKLGPSIMESMFPNPDADLMAKAGPRVPIGQSPYFDPKAYSAGRKGLNPEQAAGTSGNPLTPQMSEVPYGSVIRLPEPIDAASPINPKYMGSVPRNELVGMARGRTPGASTQLQQIGNKVLYTVPEGYPGPRSSSAFSPASDMPEGNPTPFAQDPQPTTPSYAGPERRGSIRDITGPSFERNLAIKNLRDRISQLPEGHPDRVTMESQLADMLQNPFERHEGGDINSMKVNKTVSRAEAEANTQKRLEGRNKRFNSPVESN